MPAKTPPSSAPVSAPHEILKWSSNRPDWQRDALRRIITQDTLVEADLIALDRLCRAKHQADFCTDPPVVSDPLSEAHLPPAPGAESSVTLLSIGNMQRVNRLPTDQSLTFGDNAGLTVIYGDNGSGKSGYVRVIKKACRTRGALPVIRPNAFAPATTLPASADIVCRVAGVTPTISWNDGAVSDGRLANVFVFDDSTAGHYLEEDAPASFSPSGLDILPKLSKACDLITARIQTEIDAIKSEITANAKYWKTTSSTVVGKLIDQLTGDTKKTDVEALALFSPKQALRLTELKEALKSDPKQKALETTASANRLRSFAAKIATNTRELTDVALLALRKLIEDAVATSEVAKTFAGGQVTVHPVGHSFGVGESVRWAARVAPRNSSVLRPCSRKV
ncbi:hypothetical protein BH11PLA2_BH11PLA2_52690 [soil metagenome]